MVFNCLGLLKHEWKKVHVNDMIFFPVVLGWRVVLLATAASGCDAVQARPPRVVHDPHGHDLSLLGLQVCVYYRHPDGDCFARHICHRARCIEVSYSNSETHFVRLGT